MWQFRQCPRAMFVCVTRTRMSVFGDEQEMKLEGKKVQVRKRWTDNAVLDKSQ